MHVGHQDIEHTFDNSINRTAFLTETTVDAFRHVDIVSCCPPATVFSFFGLNCNSRCRTDGLAQLTCDAALFASGVSSESVFAAETRRDGAFLEGIVDCISSGVGVSWLVR